jgi:uncharacterized membrane protein YhaH (DUF805 family)
MSDQAQAGYPGQGGEPPLDHPWYGIGFVDAVKRVFKKYATFQGRASRGEYWWWALFTVIVAIVGYGIAIAVILGTQRSDGQLSAGAYIVGVLFFLVWLALLVPSIAVAVRRLHDAGYSGWFYLLALIPSVGGIIVLVLCVMQTSPQADRFGPPAMQQPYPQQGYPPQA